MSEVGSSSVSIFPTFRGFRSAVVGEVDATAETAGSRFSTGFGKAVKGIGAGLAAGLGLALAGAAAIAKKGLDRALNIQDAKAQLAGLGHSAESVSKIMESALASVKGTAFGLDSAATIAASAVAAGIKPGLELTRTLKLTADAATIGKASLSEMGDMVNKVATNGKLTTEVLNQFQSRGIPLLQLVADEYGITAEAASKMVTKGEVDFATFQKALEKGVGGAALASGSTARGAFANIGAAFGRLGAMFTGSAVDAAPALFTAIASAVDRLAEGLKPLSTEVGGFTTNILGALTDKINSIDFSQVGARISEVLANIRAAVAGVKDFFSSVGSGDSGAVTAAFDSIGNSIKTLKPAFAEFGAELPKIGGAVAKLAGAGLGVLTDVLSFLADNVDTIIAYMPLIVTGFIAWRVAAIAVANAGLLLRAGELLATPIYFANNVMRANSVRIERQLFVAKGQAAAATVSSTAATAASTAAETGNAAAKSTGLAATLRNTAGNIASRVAMLAGAAATGIATAAQWAWNAAMTANPIGIIIVAIAALVAGLIWFFTQTELGQEIWANFTRFLSEAWANIVAVATTVFTELGNFFSDLWNGIVTFVTAYIEALRFVITTVVTAIVTAWNGFWQGIADFFTTIWEAIVAYVTAYVTIMRAIIIAVVTAISSTWNSIWSAIAGFFEGVWNGIVGFVRGVVTNIAGAISGFVNGVRTNIENVIGFVRDIPGKVLGFLGNLGKLLVNSGRDLIQGFIDGIKAMIGKVGDAIGGIMDFVAGFFPRSPAKRGPFSGSGWTKLKTSGGAIADQFAAGFAESAPDLTASLRGAVTVAATGDASTLSVTQLIAQTTNSRVDDGTPSPDAGDGPVDLSDATIEKLARALAGYGRVLSRQGEGVTS